MKPNFALSLSFEGIELLHRVRHGWKRLGTADVEDKNLDKALADLRAKAERQAPDGVYCKLIIPLDQIKYVAIDSTQTTEADIISTLDGATPYNLDELLFDCERFGGRTHIAAVAQETLAEAEAFAHAHGFNPVSFVAIPEPFTFQKEVFFGPTSMMEDILGFGAEVEADPIPVMIVGTRIKSRLLVFDLPEDAIPPSDDFDLAAALAPQDAKAQPAEVEASQPPVAEFDLAAALAPHVAEDNPEPPDADTPPDVPALDDVAEIPVVDASDVIVEDATVAEDDLSAEPMSDEDFVSIHDEAPEEPQHDPLIEAVGQETELLETAPKQDLPPLVLAQEDALSVQPAPQIFDRVIAEYHAPIVAEAPEVIAAKPMALIPEAPVFSSLPLFDRIIPAYDAPVMADVPDAPTVAPAVRLIPETPIFASLPLFDRIIPELVTGQTLALKQPAVLRATAPPVAAKTPKLGAAEPLVSRQGAVANDNRKPMWVAGLIAASLVLAGVVAWSQFGGLQDDAVALPAEVAVIDVETIADDSVEVPEVAETIVADVVEAPELVPEIIAVPPQTPFLELVGIAPPSETTVYAPPALGWSQTPDRLIAGTTPDLLAAPVAADGLPAPIQAPPAPPEDVAEVAEVAEVGAPVLRGRVLSPDDATRIYEATGVWQRAPRIVDVPGVTTTNGLIVPFSETVPSRLAQPQMPGEDMQETDLSFLAPADPPPADVAFPRDADGFILATPEGTLTPEGAVVIAGTPAIAGQLRPELTEADLARMALLAPAPEGVVIIAGAPPTVPPLRPADAALPAPEDVIADATSDDDASPAAGGVALSSIRPDDTDALVVITDPDAVDIRPQPRPSALASTAVPADPGTPDITSIIAGIEAEAQAEAFENATEEAVVASLRPEGRPDNFASVVASARARQAAPAPQAAAPVQTAAPVAPQNFAPVPGGVARAATQEDVIRLREINLIGVYGRPNSRRALVRLSNGRYVRVEVGSALDGGQVTAIGEDALNYVKRGRTIALQLPAG